MFKKSARDLHSVSKWKFSERFLLLFLDKFCFQCIMVHSPQGWFFFFYFLAELTTTKKGTADLFFSFFFFLNSHNEPGNLQLFMATKFMNEKTNERNELCHLLFVTALSKRNRLPFLKNL